MQGYNALWLPGTDHAGIATQLMVERQLATEGCSRAALDPLLASDAGVDGRESLALLFALPGLRRRARYAAALLFPSPRFMAVEYGVTGRGGLALAYGRRARHVLWEGVKGTARLLRLI